MEATKMALSGSQKLIEDLARKGAGITAEDFRKFMGLSPDVDFKLLNILTHGIPPALFELRAVLEVRPTDVGTIVQSLANRGLTGVWFPYGIPFIDRSLINVTNVPNQTIGPSI
jgi:hypothetical protein